jgi:N-acetylglucosamine kinase-like BadF-type ATPase
MMVLLAIDGGGTRTRCIALDQQGRVVSKGESGPSNHLHVPLGAATAALREATAAALSAANATVRDVAIVSAGLAGVDFDGTGRHEAVGMLHDIGFERVVVEGDMVIAHRGALAGDPGVIALAGTGSSVLGIALDGTMIKAGGWGPLYGDQGSAYQLGRLGLVAAAEAYDRSGPRTILLSKLMNALGVTDFPATMSRLYSDRSGQAHVAALGRVVNECAEEGDDVAVAICRQAGADLAREVLAVLGRLSLSQGGVPAAGGPVSYQGAVLRGSPPVRAAFVATLRAQASGVDVRPPRFEAIVGAALIGARQAGWTLPVDGMEILRAV